VPISSTHFTTWSETDSRHGRTRPSVKWEERGNCKYFKISEPRESAGFCFPPWRRWVPAVGKGPYTLLRTNNFFPISSAGLTLIVWLHSAALPSFSHLDLEKLKRESAEHYQKHPSVAALTMSTAPLVSVSNMYSGPPPPYSYPSSTASSVTGLAGYISPPESRRTSENDKEPPASQKQSLPSIHEALAADQPLSYTAPPPAPANSSQSHHSAPALTPTTPIPRSHPATSPQGPPNPFSHGQPLSLYSSQNHQPRTTHPPQHSFGPSEANPPPINAYESKLEHVPPVRTTQAYSDAARSDIPNLSQPRISPTYGPGLSSAGPMNSQTQNGYKPFQQPSYTYQPQPQNTAPSPYHPSDPYHGHNAHPNTWRSDGSEINRAEEGRKAASRGASLGGQSYGESVKRHLDIFDLETSLNEVSR